MSRQRGKASVVVGLRYDAMREEGQPRHLPFRLQIVSFLLPPPSPDMAYRLSLTLHPGSAGCLTPNGLGL